MISYVPGTYHIICRIVIIVRGGWLAVDAMQMWTNQPEVSFDMHACMQHDMHAASLCVKSSILGGTFRTYFTYDMYICFHGEGVHSSSVYL